MNGRQPRRQDFFFIIRAAARCGRRSRRSWIFCARNATAHSGVPKSYSPRHLLAKIRHYAPLDWRLIVAVHFVAYWHFSDIARSRMNFRFRWKSARVADITGTTEFVESPGGISPPGAPKTVREPLDSHGSRCSAVSMT